VFGEVVCSIQHQTSDIIHAISRNGDAFKINANQLRFMMHDPAQRYDAICNALHKRNGMFVSLCKWQYNDNSNSNKIIGREIGIVGSCDGYYK
jgi:hypothetical protein